ncbi:MAG: tRNA lysidine(34) synthetase TilS [Bacteroidetes bacterium GWF2_43_63]|nr:MAG: tRNA lysidine(34) synthetase TilS [Bacteroidetes bacterium GWE2_42_42]OFY53150.1 MAG: tRNA lysidine(34) synthetase TilS [Bacteroidetes bacterium GWF2_43_63]HBG70336.1 tRNA lysidine(34) synthetase TilS [Bacteroidales bacterium]HCB60617.1 tRNA lysidine(34) synthetase TilS [Bacteroidales bacterium]HCY22986.1 tRNA lysidine(34) synthetase TilS [Bacteroidales bacterium]
MIELHSFEEHLSNLCPEFRNKKYLLGISGGIDSMVMLHLFQNAQLNFAVAHCNFQLRGEESNRDMNFVFDAVKENKCRLFETRFETKTFAQKNRMNIQEAARKLRYNFFTETAANNGFDYICTAHNRDDVVETLIMGLNRRGSLTTLAGIREIENQLLRPMLDYSRAEIQDYAARNMISHVEDSSNISDKYLRNKIRHHLIPLLEEIMPGFIERAAGSVSFLRDYQKYFASATETELAKFGDPNKEGLDLLNLIQHPSANLLLMQFLLGNGFFPADAAEILKITNHSEPREFLAPEKTLHVHRGKMILRMQDTTDDTHIWYIDEDLDTSMLPINLKAEWVVVSSEDEVKTGVNTVFLNPDEIIFPLFVRKWQAGERFMPMGMYQQKKIGDFFTDLKITVAERDRAMVLHSGSRIAWLVGYRADERFRIRSFPSQALKLQIL